jgi:hypothetical protein
MRVPISQAGFTCERDPHIDSSDWTASESDHLLGVTNEHTAYGHGIIGADITYGYRHSARRGMPERCGVGGVAGHVADHHAVIGAAGRCIVGHHYAKEKGKERAVAVSQRSAVAPS